MKLLLDGVDGVGKSTLVDGFCDLPFTDDFDFDVVSFPSALPAGTDTYDNVSRALFHLRDFHHTLRRKKADHLILDRSFITTLCYQGFQQGTLLDREIYEAVMMLGSRIFFDESIYNDVITDPTILCHVTCDVEVAAARITAREEGADEVDLMRFDARLEHLGFLEKRLELAYADVERRFAGVYPIHVIRLDTTHTSEQEALQQLMGLLTPYLDPDQFDLFSQTQPVFKT